MKHDRKQRKTNRAGRTFKKVRAGDADAGKGAVDARLSSAWGTTTLDHAIAVAYYSLMLDQKWKLNCDKGSLVRGALLHDYFLYDWHQPHKEYGLHGFTHPSTALRNAVQDFDLNAVERNIIARHMFPLVPIPPRYRESVIVCLADKFCSLNETFSRQRYLTLVRLLSAALIFQR